MVSIRSAFAIATVAFIAAVNASSNQAFHRSLQAVSFRTDLLNEINTVREAKGLQPLCLDQGLMYSAQAHSNDMAENNFVTTTGSDGKTPMERAQDEGHQANIVTEVVAAGYRTASSVVAEWAEAESAPQTLLGSKTAMGPGYTFDKTRKYVHYWAVDFSDGQCRNKSSTTAGGVSPQFTNLEDPEHDPLSTNGAPQPPPAETEEDET